MPPTAFRVPLYPMLIVTQAMASTGTVISAALLARQRFGDWAGLVAGGLCAVHPFYVWHDLALQETGMFTFLAAMATVLLCAARGTGRWRYALLAGAVLGAAILTRTTLLPFALIGCLWLALPAEAKPVPYPRRAVSAALALAALGATLSPWLIRAHTVTGSYGLGTELGAAIYAGNHPLTFADYPDRSIDVSRAKVFAAIPPAERAELAVLEGDEVAQSSWFLRKGLAHIAAHPGDFAVGALQKLWAAFRPLPSPRHGGIVDLGYAVFWCPLLVLGLAGLWRERRHWQRDVPFHAHIIAFAGIAAVIWAHTSHRSYLDIYLIVFAAGLLAGLWRGWRHGLRGKALLSG